MYMYAWRTDNPFRCTSPRRNIPVIKADPDHLYHNRGAVVSRLK